MQEDNYEEQDVPWKDSGPEVTHRTERSSGSLLVGQTGGRRAVSTPSILASHDSEHGGTVSSVERLADCAGHGTALLFDALAAKLGR